MLEGLSIVSFARDRWNDVPRCRHHVMSRLAERNRVLFVSRSTYIGKALEAIVRPEIEYGLSQVTPNLFSFVPPPWLPFSYRPWLDAALSTLMVARLGWLFRQLRMTRPIAYVWHPAAVDLVERLDAQLVVYHCYDEVAAFAGAEPERIRDQERRLLQCADVVFAVSPGLCRRKRAVNPNVFLVRNGVDAARFGAARAPATAVPADIASIKRPVVGCVTRVVPEYFDAGLLRQVFSRRPDWSLVVVGPETGEQAFGRAELRALQALPNVHFLGLRPFDSLPGYLKAMDVCLIPYRLTENKLLADPLKVYEYLAAGKPVVSVPLEELADDVARLVAVGPDAETWIAAIEDALASDNSERQDARQAVAFANTWDERVRRISTHVLEALARRHGSDASAHQLA